MHPLLPILPSAPRAAALIIQSLPTAAVALVVLRYLSALFCEYEIIATDEGDGYALWLVNSEHTQLKSAYLRQQLLGGLAQWAATVALREQEVQGDRDDQTT